MDRNFIVDMPREIGKCTRLTLLSFCHNKLTKIPDEISALTSLMSLQLSHNELVLGTAGWLAELTFLQVILPTRIDLVLLPCHCAAHRPLSPFHAHHATCMFWAPTSTR